eukprot:TRINITY_DN1444_c0_g1_i3.p1 TRINITY_DN1444_c0_g1~~TRINITY_DN1444_c0_g1_i3.p1  ORF type:complete len:183 (+),score=22.22 TRINITY_DN1444_c0_g1_i3:110-658(+)
MGPYQSVSEIKENLRCESCCNCKCKRKPSKDDGDERHLGEAEQEQSSDVTGALHLGKRCQHLAISPPRPTAHTHLLAEAQTGRLRHQGQETCVLLSLRVFQLGTTGKELSSIPFHSVQTVAADGELVVIGGACRIVTRYKDISFWRCSHFVRSAFFLSVDRAIPADRDLKLTIQVNPCYLRV